MGHAWDDTRAAYFRASPEKLKEIYMQYAPYLIIQKELNITESPEYQRIKKENEVLRAKTERYIIDRHDLQEIRKAIDNLAMIPTPDVRLDSTPDEKEMYEKRRAVEERNKRLQKIVRGVGFEPTKSFDARS